MQQFGVGISSLLIGQHMLWHISPVSSLQSRVDATPHNSLLFPSVTCCNIQTCEWGAGGLHQAADIVRRRGAEHETRPASGAEGQLCEMRTPPGPFHI